MTQAEKQGDDATFVQGESDGHMLREQLALFSQPILRGHYAERDPERVDLATPIPRRSTTPLSGS